MGPQHACVGGVGVRGRDGRRGAKPSEASASEPQQSPSTTIETKGRRTRKQRFKNLPRPAIAVRGLLEAASEQERKKAQETCALILELWLGKTSKAEISRRLQLPPLRVWQLSQQALSGMIAGLLVQPRTRQRVTAGAGVASIVKKDPATDTTQLQREIVSLKQDLMASSQVNAFLKQFPALTPAAKERRGEPHATKHPPTKAARTTTPANQPRAARASRKAAANGSDPTGTTGSRRPEPRRDDAHPANVDAPRAP